MTRPLIVFGEDWGRHPSSTQHLITRLASNRDIIWINSIGLRRPKFSRADMGRVINKIVTMLKKSAPDNPKRLTPPRMSITQPRAISWPGSKIACIFNRYSISRQIKAELARRDLKNPIIWTSLPSAIDVIDNFSLYPCRRGWPEGSGEGFNKTTPIIYYCGDDFSALEGVDHAPIKIMEDRLSARSNVILAASEVLAKRFSGAKTILMPHGVDINLFQMPQLRPEDLPKSSKIAGFYGSISSWIDVEALARTATLMPEWTFVLIGKIRTDISCLKPLSNVIFLGEKPHHELAAYVQHWNVSLLPFKNTPQIQACNPLKLREYLSVGTPIVSTYFNALEPYKDLIEIAAFNNNYRSAIAIAARDVERNESRRASVAHESWDQRAADIELILKRFE
jgi:glycosyltransferase involved in cell wall biosynthesis